MPAAPKEIPAGSRRERILDAAIREFATRGYDGATWRRIAERAGVNQGLIRFYFEDKEGLWRAAFRLSHERRVAGMPPAVALSGDPDADEAAVASWLRAYVRHVAAHPDEARMLVQEGAVGEDGQASERTAWAAKEVLTTAHEEFLTGVGALQEVGWFEGFEARDLLYLMSGAGQYVYLVPGEVMAVAGYDPRSEAALARHADAIVRLFTAHAPKR